MIERHDYTPAALYARVSSDRQDVDLSVAAQLRALRDHAQKNGYIVVREYHRPPAVPQDDRRGYQARGPLQGNPHPADTIATENSGTRGRSIWAHSS